EAGGGSDERLESEVLQIDRRAHVPRIRQDKATRFVERAKLRDGGSLDGIGFVHLCISLMLISDLSVRWTGHFPATSISFALCSGVREPINSTSTSILSSIPSLVRPSSQSF